MLEVSVIIPLFWGISYIIGSIPVSYVLARLKGVNLLSVGTKNPGGMNAWRNAHPLIGITGGLGDVLKATLAVSIAISIANTLEAESPIKDLLITGSSMLVVLGHQKSLLLRILEGKWTGGKGFGCYAGIILAFSWIAFFVLFAVLMGLLQIPKKRLRIKTNLPVNVVVAVTSFPIVWIVSNELTPLITMLFIIPLLFWADRTSLMRGFKQVPLLRRNRRRTKTFADDEIKQGHHPSKPEILLNQDDFLGIIDVAMKTLHEWKSHLNMINVFPVPDGDTGTNLVETLKSIKTHVLNLRTREQGYVVKNPCQELGKGIIKAGRGNSGLIFTQWLEGVVSTCCTGSDQNWMLKITPEGLLGAFRRGYLKAWKAVTRPKEGLILTVMKQISEINKEDPPQNDLKLKQLASYIEKEIINGVRDTIPRMEKLTGVKVADAGTVGFAIFMDVFLSRLNHDTSIILELSRLFDNWLEFDYLSVQLVPRILEQNDSFCIQCTIESAEFHLDKLVEILSALGDCLHVASNPPCYRIHLHSNDPDRVLAVIFEGDHEITDIHIDNIKEQVQEQIALRKQGDE